jgi:uncharacterized protein YqgV (UPF0045/DUF77 family)
MIQSSIAIQVLPKADGPELIRIVDAVIAYIKSTGLHTFVGPFETTVEGDYDQLMEIIRNCQLICVREGAPSVMSYVKINYSPNGILTTDEKISKHH